MGRRTFNKATDSLEGVNEHLKLSLKPSQIRGILIKRFSFPESFYLREDDLSTYAYFESLIMAHDWIQWAINKLEKVMGTGVSEDEYSNPSGDEYWFEMAQLLGARDIIAEQLEGEGRDL